MEEYTIAEAKEEIRKGILAYYSRDMAGSPRFIPLRRIPFCLEGPPGIGKTEIVKQLAEELNIGFVSFSVTHHTRNSLLGLPVIRELENGEKYTEYTMSEIIAGVRRSVEEGNERGILLLDEFNCASETIMPTMLAFLQTRNIGFFKLPEDWIIVLCENPPEYNPHARKFGPALMDRVRYIPISNDAGSFLSYAGEKNFHPAIRSFLKQNPEMIYRIEKEKDELVTNRGWENLSCTIESYEAEGLELTRRSVSQYIKSDEIAGKFFQHWCLCQKSFGEKEAEQIIMGKGHAAIKKKLEEESFSFREQALEIIEKKLLSLVSEKLKDGETGKDAASGMLSNVFRFLKKMGKTLEEEFFFFVTENQELVELLSGRKNEEYLSVARRSYGLEA